MRKKLAKILTVVAAFTLMIPVFALAGCTDDKDDSRTLDGIELSIVGEWKTNQDTLYTFKSDGTYEVSNGNKGEFRHEGEGIYDNRHYCIIKRSSGDISALFDDDSNHMYNISQGTPQTQNPYFSRI